MGTTPTQSRANARSMSASSMREINSGGGCNSLSRWYEDNAPATITEEAEVVAGRASAASALTDIGDSDEDEAAPAMPSRKSRWQHRSREDSVKLLEGGDGQVDESPVGVTGVAPATATAVRA